MSTPTPNRVPTDPPSSHRAIENLIATYAELVDDGDFAGVGMGPPAPPTGNRRIPGPREARRCSVLDVEGGAGRFTRGPLVPVGLRLRLVARRSQAAPGRSGPRKRR